MKGDRWAQKNSGLVRYGAAGLAALAATLIRISLIPLIGETAVPFITYFPAVLFVAWYSGFGAATLCILLSALAADYYFVPLTRSLLIPGPGDQIT